jgi:hypothetical protein
MLHTHVVQQWKAGEGTKTSYENKTQTHKHTNRRNKQTNKHASERAEPTNCADLGVVRRVHRPEQADLPSRRSMRKPVPNKGRPLHNKGTGLRTEGMGVQSGEKSLRNEGSG